MFNPRDDARDRDGREDGRERVYDERDREDDPREGLMRDLDLPRGEERELVAVRDHVYELDGEDSRTLAAVGAFRVVPEHDLDIDHDTLDRLRDEGLVETVDLSDDERGLTLTREGRARSTALADRCRRSARIRAHHNGASTAISTRRARHSPTTNRVRVGDAMDVPERADITPEPIAIARCRELLGDEADALSDDEVRDVARHAEAMARILIALALQNGRIH